MKKIWVNKTDSFRKAEKLNTDYYQAMSGIERLKIVQLLREIHYKIKGRFDGQGRKRLRRVVKIIQ